MKNKVCVPKNITYLFFGGIAFFALIFGISLLNNQNVSLFSRASEKRIFGICAIDLSTMKNTNTCCSVEDNNNGYKCYLGKYIVNCQTKDVEKKSCSAESVKKNRATTSISTEFMPDFCDRSGSGEGPISWQANCCNSQDVDKGRFKCVRTPEGKYVQFHCSAQRYWQCESNCFTQGGIIYPTCAQIVEGSAEQLPTLIPSSPIVKQPSLIIRATPTQTPNVNNSNTDAVISFLSDRNISFKTVSGHVVLNLTAEENKNLHALFSERIAQNINSFSTNTISGLKTEVRLSLSPTSSLYYTFTPFTEKNRYPPFLQWMQENTMLAIKIGGEKIIPSSSFPKIIGVSKDKKSIYFAPDIFDDSLIKMSTSYPNDAQSHIGLEHVVTGIERLDMNNLISVYNFSHYNDDLFVYIPSSGDPCVVLEIKKEDAVVTVRGVLISKCL